jgi:hypothetical protein
LFARVFLHAADRIVEQQIATIVSEDVRRYLRMVRNWRGGEALSCICEQAGGVRPLPDEALLLPPHHDVFYRAKAA